MSVIANETNLLNQYKNSGITSNLYPKIVMKLNSVSFKSINVFDYIFKYNFLIYIT